jgi:predicted DNA-binding transcriptional regulator AlpA
MNNWHDLPLTLNATHVAAVLGVSKPIAYEIMHRKDFPAIRVSERRLVVGRDKLQEWLDEKAGSP